ncbi:hypothetical protein [Burkholderia ubonensis]|uniref:hypothetical protein n=1 Tax=Burkholderia ubonensis TaxID=101571 RepID=UPI000A5A6B9B|nr:hypothetical protein [Burkholderia ubonensis]
MVSLTLCKLCLSFSGLYSNFDRCCQIRLLANMPKERRRREYARIEAHGGRESLAEVIKLVKAEYQRGQVAREGGNRHVYGNDER